jgi:hypothetical protein
MSRKKLICLTTIALLLLGGSLLTFHLLFRDPIQPWNCQRIHFGMTESEVEAILGRQADDQYHPWEFVPYILPENGTSPEWEKAWLGEDWAIFVQFDSQGKVCARGYREKDLDNTNATFSRSLWRLLGW